MTENMRLDRLRAIHAPKPIKAAPFVLPQIRKLNGPRPMSMPMTTEVIRIKLGRPLFQSFVDADQVSVCFIRNYGAVLPS